MRGLISDELKRMLETGVIERIESSPWISNIVTARKKDGGVRICVNMTAANQALIPERHPLPTMEELTAKVAGCTVFSKLDLLWGYTQLELDPEVRYLTAFVTHDGVFQFRTVVFGMSTGPSAFQSVIRKILDGLEGCTNILDDILVYGFGTVDHDNKLRKVLERLSRYNATVRADKCVIGQPEVEFNGHRVSAEGVRPLQSNVDAILNMPVPTDQRQLTRFLCTSAYYLKFLPRFADLCTPLRALLKDGTPWIWTSECQSRYDEIKRCIASPPVLAHFDVNADTYVTTDASAQALGALLSQRKDGVEKPVAFASRSLTPAERKYSAAEREALAAVWACEKWNFYLYGRPFTLITDHQALRSLLSTGGSGHRPLRLHRWSTRLFRYSFKVVYKPGADNVVADCLSRAPPLVVESQPSGTSSMTEQEMDEDIFVDVQTIFGSLNSAAITLDQVALATDADDLLQEVMKYTVNGWPASRKQLQPEIRPYFDCRMEFSVLRRCLVRGYRTVIPSALRSQVLTLVHEGHPGIVRMKRLCRDTLWWPGIDSEIEQLVKHCTPCILSGKSVHPTPGPLQPLPWPQGPWRRISVDIAGEFVAAPHHQRFIIVAIDHYSKWPEAAVCGSVTSSSVIEFLTSLFDRFGLVEELITDNGVQFVSAEFQAFLRQHGIRHYRSSLYSPQSNAAVERFNRVLKKGIKAGLAEGVPFFDSMRRVLATYRFTPHSTTGVSPSSLMLSFAVRTPVTMLSSSFSTKPRPSPMALRKSVSFQQTRMSTYHDRRKHARPTEVKAGDYVRILLPQRKHKLFRSFSDPVLVTRVKGNMVYVNNGQRWNLRRCVKHHPLLKSSNTSVAPLDCNDQLSVADAESDCPTFNFAVSQSVPLESHVTVPRRSTRVRTQRDLGPVIRF